MKEIDQELEQKINELYPKYKNFVELIRCYNRQHGNGKRFFSDYDQEAIEIAFEIIEEVYNSF